jgi:Mg/Co/Ni transporter MgtE
MSYKIISIEPREETLNTEVEYTFNDGTKKIVTVSHFMPKTQEEVLQNIQNREDSEQIKIQAIKKNEELAKELDIETNQKIAQLMQEEKKEEAEKIKGE